VIGVDASAVAVNLAIERAVVTGLAAHSRFDQGTFSQTGLDDGSVAGVMSIDALQYAPDKDGALAEAARIIRPGGRVVFAAFEFEPGRVEGLPVLGSDPVDDYAPRLEAAGFAVDSYAETPQWFERLSEAYGRVLDAREVLIAEMGELAVAALESELSTTLQVKPYRRRVLAVATRR
jgi:ubiquinone/menaquinone biosynthesis C-methylase UbiE